MESIYSGTINRSDPQSASIEEGLYSAPLDPLALDIPDDELIDIIDQRIRDSRTFYSSKYNLYERRKELEMYYFGRQIHEKEDMHQYKDYESRAHDNVLYEIGATIKPLGMSRLPDLMVIPGNDSDEAVMTAEQVSKAVDSQIKEIQNRYVLGLAFKQLPVYFTGVIKTYWDPEKDDYVFEAIHPDFIDVDYTCPTNNADDMNFISHLVPLTVQEVAMRFPSRKEQFFAELKKQGLMVGDTPNYLDLATTVKIREVWFTWYARKSEHEWERVEGVIWKYQHCILKKMKNPDFDYQGEERFFSYDDPNNGTKRALNRGELGTIMATGQLPPKVKQETVYHNYFQHPRKPFFFMGYDKWGKQPYDETSWMEQNLPNQKTLDHRNKQLDETLDQRGHHVFSKESGLTPADVEEMDLNAPDQDIVVDGDVSKTHAFIAPERPGREEFDEIDKIHDRMYAISGSNAVRGEIQSDTATTNQIARESDFTRADDLVEDTINAAAQWMADWSLQFIKLRYTKDHFRQILGVAGDVIWMKLNQNMVSDGMIVKIKSSGTDKLRAQHNAMDMAKMQMTDPYSFFVDMGLSDPEGRTEKLMLAKADPIAYLQKVVKGVNTSQALAEALMRQQIPSPAAQQPVSQPSPIMAGQGQQPGSQPVNQIQPAPGQIAPGGAQQPSPGNTSQIAVAPQIAPPQGSPRVV